MPFPSGLCCIVLCALYWADKGKRKGNDRRVENDVASARRYTLKVCGTKGENPRKGRTASLLTRTAPLLLKAGDWTTL